MPDISVKVVPHPDEIQKLKRALGYGLLNLGFFIETQAKSRCPYRTGNLRRSIHTVGYHEGKVLLESNESGKALPAYAKDGTGVIVGTNAGYGAFVELGTFKMAAQPFLTPAAQEGLSRASELIADGAQQHYRASP